MITFKEYLTEGAKVGDIVKITSKNLVYEYTKNSGQGFFEDSFDPQGGAGGWDPFQSSIASKQALAWTKKHQESFGNAIDYFLPKSPTLQRLKLEAQPYSNQYRYSHSDAFPIVGKVRPIERYKFIVDEATYKALPEDTIGTSSYDYSFHAGSGIVASWIMAIGASQSDVKSKLDAALKKVKTQYVGSEMELKYAQKRAVGR
jgi:hypothetical protein